MDILPETLTRPQDVARFVPAFILSRLAADPAPLSAAGSEAYFAAVVFADISGFTALSERLARRGPDGVEELTQILNTYFGQLIDLITAHGGDVVKFAGDALLAFWPVADVAGLDRVTQLAAQCSLQVQATLRKFGANFGERLTLRIGIGAGPVAVLSVGGVLRRWESIIVGPAVLEATLAACKVEPGSVVLGAAAWSILRNRCEASIVSVGYHRLHLVKRTLPLCPAPEPSVAPEVVPSVLSYLPAAIHRRLAARQSAWLTELRRLTVVFVNLPEFNAGTPLAEAQEMMRTLQTALYLYEGSVNKLSVDEKGVTLVAALGLPPLAHEDDALRGVLAGLAMQNELTRLGWRSSVGVTSGAVFCGTIGSEKRCEYTIMGDVVNLAARLMQAADGGILCDEPTFRAAPSRLAWEALPAITVKGKTHPIPIFRPLGQMLSASAPQTTHSMVGRAAEQACLERRLQQLARGDSGGVIIIEGEAGIGKSRLVRHLEERAEHHGLPTLVGGADAVERATPYYAWRPVFRTLFHLDDPDESPDESRDRVIRELAFDPELVPLAPLLNVVLSVDLPETLVTDAMFGEIRVNNTRGVLVSLLRRRTSASPLQLILEDCHWLDSASWALAAQVAQEVSSLLLILVTRPLSDPVPREYTQLIAAPATERLILSPLSQEECLSLVCHRLGVDSLPAPVAALLRMRAQGNPFFIEELVYALREAEKIHVLDGQCTVSPGVDLDTLPFPDTVQGLVTSRIDRLSPQEQLILKVASVIGRTFGPGILYDVCPIEEDKPNLARYLATFTRQNLTLLDAPDPEPVYLFKHVITQEVAYQMMGAGQRRLLHQSVAEWYEGTHKSDLSPYFPLLAKHWSHTDQFAKALEYLDKAGTNAMRDFANEEAVGFFSQALLLDTQSGCLCPPFRRACWQGHLGAAYYNLSKLDLSLQHFELALELLGYTFPRSGWGMLLGTAWEIAKQGAYRIWPSRVFGKAGDREASCREAARAYERVAEIRYLQNARVPTIHAAFRALNLSELLGESPELARSYANAAMLKGMLMMHGAARTHCARARTMAAAVNQLSCVAYVEFIRASYWITAGEWEAAEHDVTKAMGIMKRIGERHHLGECAFVLNAVLSRKGDFQQSAALSLKLHSSDRYREAPQIQVWGMSWQIWCLLTLDPESSDLARIEAALMACLRDVSLTDGDRILGYSLIALACWRRGDVNQARIAADAVEQLMVGSNQVAHYLLEAYAGLAEIYMGMWMSIKAEATLIHEMRLRTENIINILGQFSLMYPIGRPRKWLVRGQYHLLRGRKLRAARTWEKALLAAEQLRLPYEQALAHAALGHLGSVNDSASARHLSRARELFERVGAAHDLKTLG